MSPVGRARFKRRCAFAAAEWLPGAARADIRRAGRGLRRTRRGTYYDGSTRVVELTPGHRPSFGKRAHARDDLAARFEEQFGPIQLYMAARHDWGTWRGADDSPALDGIRLAAADSSIDAPSVEVHDDGLPPPDHLLVVLTLTAAPHGPTGAGVMPAAA
jgi:hypothetical protein